MLSYVHNIYHRNLLTQLRHRSQIITDSSYYVSYYNYDEAGNRISKKVYKYTGSQPEPPPPDIDSLDVETDWELESDVIYSRDVTGKELAIYESDSLLQWNIWGLDNVGKIDAGGLKYFYLKDHLGSIRVIMDENPAVVFAEDYDAWGYGLEERNYAKDNSMYKFTGKERDEESFYDYFGARYYDARVSNWTSVDPLMEKHYDFSPYNYVLRNPLKLIDPDGQQVEIIQTALNIYSWYANEKVQSDYYHSLSLVGKEEFSKDYVKRMGNEGRVEATYDELLFAPIVAKGIFNIGKIGRSALTLEPVKMMETSALVSTDLNLGIHSSKRMIERNITQDMIKVTIRKGEKYWDPSNKTVNFILEKGFASGKSLLVGQNLLTGKITTVIPGMDLIKKRFIKF